MKTDNKKHHLKALLEHNEHLASILVEARMRDLAVAKKDQEVDPKKLLNLWK